MLTEPALARRPTREAEHAHKPHALLAPGRVVRRLEGTERLVAIGNEHHGGNFNVVGSIALDGPVTHSLLTHALAELQRRHECLQVEVVPDPNQREHFVFRHTPVAPRLEVSSAGWREVWAALGCEVIAGLAWRAVWTPGHLVVLFHHAVTDGVSVTVFFDRLLESMARAVDGVAEIGPTRPIGPPLHRLANAALPAKTVTRIVSQNLFGGLKTGPVTVAKPEDRRWHSAFRTLDVEQTQALLARCRAEGVTLTHAASAAATLEVADRVKSKSRFTVALCTTVDLRRVVPGLDPATFGMLSCSVHSFFAMRKKRELWPLAQEAKRQLERAFQSGDPCTLTHLHRLFGRGLASMLEGQNQGRAKDCAVLMSNIGKVDMLVHGPFCATSLFISASQRAFGSLYLLVLATVRGRLCANLSFATPVISEAEGEGALDGIFSRLGVLTER